MLDRGENLLDLIVLRPADEQNVARVEVRQLAVTTDLDGPHPDALATYCRIQEAAERVVPEDADKQWRLRGRGLPIDKLREIEQEHGLQLILRGPLALHDQQRGDQDCDRVQKCHCTVPYTPRSIWRRAVVVPNSACCWCSKF